MVEDCSCVARWSVGVDGIGSWAEEVCGLETLLHIHDELVIEKRRGKLQGQELVDSETALKRKRKPWKLTARFFPTFLNNDHVP